MLNPSWLSALPPSVPLVTETVHVVGFGLLVALVVVPALALAASALREACLTADGAAC